MATDKTVVSEMGIAVGICQPSAELPSPAAVQALQIPGVDAEWKPALLAAAQPGHEHHSLFMAAHGNGRFFRRRVLRREPQSITWSGGGKNMRITDAPEDLRVDDVYLLSAKFDSKCLLNTSPANLFDDLLNRAITPKNHQDWFEVVASERYAQFLQACQPLVATPLPPHPHQLEDPQRLALKAALKGRLSGAVEESYARFSQAVSQASCERWLQALERVPGTLKLGMAQTMLRICGTGYWLLGEKKGQPVRLKVLDAAMWRTRYQVQRFLPRVEARRQPRVDWELVVKDKEQGSTHRVEGYCEIRWSHGKFKGKPECKVQVNTPLAEIPGYFRER